MSTGFSRRRFVQVSAATAAFFSVPAARAMESEQSVEALVVGSGFGGAVASLRLGQAGIETVVLERGKRWPITRAGNTFCSIANPDGRAAWLSDTTILPAPLPSSPIGVFTGVLDRKVGTGATAYCGAGVGGGSLIYGGITYQPTKALFETVFPSSVNYDKLDKVYFPRVRAMLQATPIPDDIFQSDAYLSSRILLEQASKAGLASIKPDIAIDWDIVREEMAGKKVPSIIAGEVYYGTNSGAKNSLDHNYLKQAEETGYVEIKPLHLVHSIEEADGGLYRVQVDEINEEGATISHKTFLCRYLFLAAGSLGTPELLLRAQSNGTLRRLNDTVGKFWGTNGESTTVLVEGVQTNISLGSPGVIAIQDLSNPVAPLILETFQAEPLPQGVISVLGQGISKPEGFFTYNRKTQKADLFWPTQSVTSQKNLEALTNTYNLLNQTNGTALAAPIDQVNTGHPVGGAVIGQTCSNYGEVDGYQNLFVLDGSLIPGSAACANPSLTIAALAEQAMDYFLNQSRRR